MIDVDRAMQLDTARMVLRFAAQGLEPIEQRAIVAIMDDENFSDVARTENIHRYNLRNAQVRALLKMRRRLSVLGIYHSWDLVAPCRYEQLYMEGI